jgi:F-type H+-transporting ATPase subunit b
MIIDWYTIIFQIINFLILVFLLWRFLYGPITRTMEERERKIVEREEEAEVKCREAEMQGEALREKSEELENKREEMLDEARSAAEEEKNRLLSEARQDVDQTRRRWEEALEREQEAFAAELRRRIGLQASSLARRCLQDLTDAHLEELVLKHFTAKVDQLSEEDRVELNGGIKKDQGSINLRSAFDLDDKQQNQVLQALKNILPPAESEPQLSWKKQDDLICGLELEAGGFRVAWNIDSYLEAIEADILRELDQNRPAGEGVEEVPGVEHKEDN